MSAGDIGDFDTTFARPKRVSIADRMTLAAQIEEFPPAARPVVAPPSNRPLSERDRLLRDCMEIHRGPVMRAIRSHIGWADAEDVVSIAFHKFSEIDTAGWDTARSLAWLIMVARRLAINLMLKEKAEAKRWSAIGMSGRVPVDLSVASGREIPRWIASGLSDTSSQEILADRLESLRVAIDKLPDDQREVLVNYKLEGRPAKELAEHCGICVGSIRRKLRQALKSLEEMVSHEFE